MSAGVCLHVLRTIPTLFGANLPFAMASGRIGNRMGGEVDQVDGTRSADQVVAALATRQHGVVARRQLLGAGLTPREVERRLGTGRLHGVHRGVYLVGHTAVTLHGRWLAAVLACGPGAVLSHRFAAALWRICAAAGCSSGGDDGPGRTLRETGYRGAQEVHAHR